MTTLTQPNPTARLQRGVTTVARSDALLTVRDHAPLLVYVWAYAAIGRILIGERWLGIYMGAGVLTQATLLCAIVALTLHFCRTVLTPGGAARVFARESWRPRGWTGPRLIGGVLALSLFGPLMGAFSQFKDAIPRFHPFQFDPLLSEIDRTLHFGIDPWRITHAITPDWLTVAIDGAYYAVWGVVTLGAFAWAAWSPRSVERMQWLTAHVLAWSLLGTGLATALSSAGPVYVERLTGDPTFEPLFTSLPVRLTALDVREYLWQAYVTGTAPEYSGITAMPSMHVASALLVWLGARHHSRIAGYAGALFFGTILFGSVHLGWHYAIDGYVSILLVLLLWGLSGRFARWWLSEPAGGPRPTRAPLRPHGRNRVPALN